MDPTQTRKIIHIDMDAFYASVEQRDNPELRGKPLAVGGSRQRGVVAAASYEARDFGVRSAMASSLALRKCPDLLFVKPRFEVYKAVSNQIRAIFEQYTPLIEPLSLDEAYLDVTLNLAGHDSATQTAEAIREQIKQQTQLTASAGVSYNKFLAKLASDYNKPNGLFVIKPHQGLAFVEQLAVGQFHGIGRVTAQKMNQMGIFTGLDLRAQNAAFLTEHFGKAGQYFYSIARAVDERPVRPNRERKSVGAETTFEHDLTNYSDLEAQLGPLLMKVWSHCERTGVFGKTVTLKIKYADFRQITRSRTMPEAIRNKSQFEQLSLDLLLSIPDFTKGVRLVGVNVANFQPNQRLPGQQLRLDL